MTELSEQPVLWPLTLDRHICVLSAPPPALKAGWFSSLLAPYWKEAKTSYYTQKVHLLKEFPCLGKDGLDKILQVSWRFRSAEGEPLATLDDPHSLWVVLGDDR